MKIKLPNGQSMEVMEFLRWWRVARGRQSPRKGSAPSCVEADIFADCFTGATPGTIDGAAPGPLNGWTFIEPFGATGGEFVFSDGIMSMDTAGATENPMAAKDLPAPLASVLGISGQFDFTEYASVPNPTTTYQIFINNAGITETFSVSLFGDGNLIIQAGPTGAAPSFVGTFTPTPGGAHVVHFSVPLVGAPSLYIDGVEVTLTPIGDVPTFGASFPSNALSYGGGSGDAAAGQSPVRNIFVATGELGPETVFCCP